MLADHDFHPDEPTVRIFRTPSPGVLRLDDDVAISEAVYDGVVLRHYAFAGHWFKVNVTTGLGGCLTETGAPGRRFAVNCDLATPMERDGSSTFGVDLFTDVLVRQDTTSYVITGHDELAEMLGRGVISAAEGRGAGRGLRELLDLIEQGRLLRWLGELAPFGPCQPPPAPPMRRGPVRAPAGGNPPDLVTCAIRARRPGGSWPLPSAEPGGPVPGAAGRITLACARFECADLALLAVPDGRWRVAGLLRPGRSSIPSRQSSS